MDDRARAKSYPDGVLGVMACELALRPVGAPHFGDLAPAVRAVRRDGEDLVVVYDASVRSALARLVEAERRCCAGIGWALEDGGTTLRVTATAEQIALVEQLVRRS